MATDLAETDTRRPRRADLCRAAGTAYYALFHCPARTCADGLAGRPRSVGKRPMWRRAYRALEHGQARARCKDGPSSFPEGMRDFGQTFAELQGKRHLADYDPDHLVRKSDVIADIESVRTVIKRFLAPPAGVRRDFAIHVPMKVRADA